MKYRPIVPLNGNEKGVIYFDGKEMFAIFCGLCACTEHNKPITDKAAIEIFKDPAFQPCFDSLLHLLQKRNYTSESLILIFETFYNRHFPQKMVPQR
jgi:hypothetical protein